MGIVPLSGNSQELAIDNYSAIMANLRYSVMVSPNCLAGGSGDPTKIKIGDRNTTTLNTYISN